MTMTERPRVQRKSDNEVVISAPRGVAFAHVAEAMEKLGAVKQRDPVQNFIDGLIKYGLNSVKVRASLVERDPVQTTVVMQGSSGEVWGVAAKNASKRLVEMLENLDNPGFKADRLGINPVALVAGCNSVHHRGCGGRELHRVGWWRRNGILPGERTSCATSDV